MSKQNNHHECEHNHTHPHNNHHEENNSKDIIFYIMDKISIIFSVKIRKTYLLYFIIIHFYFLNYRKNL